LSRRRPGRQANGRLAPAANRPAQIRSTGPAILSHHSGQSYATH
jgi:hypothetical protein